MTIQRKYRDDWPVQVLQRSAVVKDRQGIAACEACGHRVGGHHGRRDRSCFNCGRVLDWPKED